MEWTPPLAEFAAAAIPWRDLALRFVVLTLAGWGVYEVAYTLACRMLARRPLAKSLLEAVRGTLRAALVLACALLLVKRHAPALPGQAFLQGALELSLVVVVTLAALKAIANVARAIIALHPADMADNLAARRLQTQVTVLSRTLMFVAVLLGVSAVLMMTPSLKSIGTSLLASAGIVGLAAGLAAKPVLGNLLAGLQIAFTQPIRLDDVVIVQGEWGRVEEIRSAYVVVKIWDERRLVVPLQWFVENPFQNWTRTSADILGSVFLWVDYAMPVDALREEAQRICAARADWDGRLCILHVTEATEEAVQVRVLVSSRNADQSWELRCALREGLVAFVQRAYPQCLPRRKLEVAGA